MRGRTDPLGEPEIAEDNRQMSQDGPNIKDAELLRTLEIDSKELEAIARRYDESSPQYAAIRRAAWSLIYVVMHRRKKFADFIAEMSRSLTDSERQQLRVLVCMAPPRETKGGPEQGMKRETAESVTKTLLEGTHNDSVSLVLSSCDSDLAAI